MILQHTKAEVEVGITRSCLSSVLTVHHVAAANANCYAYMLLSLHGDEKDRQV